MKFETEKVEISNINLCRKLNYRIKSKDKQLSCVKPIRHGDYPRFHLFIEEGDKLKFKLHLDQKGPSYEKSTAHSGEYESERVKREAKRIKSAIKRL